ncbi:hypothetical protein NPIL_203901 [Nephila pilipes]|uniref:Uncharacterized protein n=1 Tax=Nephila pilipes TaxID=299642 RepID=A0A8X6N2W4_NEPPI|nr:hypothetical protein NPIL_203901 [Nephila pilipes]
MGADAPDPVVGGVAHGDLRPPPLGRGRYPDGRRQPHACSPHTKPWRLERQSATSCSGKDWREIRFHRQLRCCESVSLSSEIP